MSAGPLSGYVIGVTADRRSSEQLRLLEARGAECLHGPVIQTHPVGPQDELERATRELIDDPPDAVLMLTGIGVRSWFEAADALHLGEALRSALNAARVLTRGSKTAGAAVAAGLEVAFNARSATSAELVDELLRRGPTTRVAVQLDGSLGHHVTRALAEAGLAVVPVPVYRWSLPDDLAPAERLVRAVAEAKVDAVTFTARPAVENLMAIAEELGCAEDVLDAFAEEVAAVCVGPVCAAGADAVGIRATVQPERPRLGPMVQVLTAHLAGRAVTVRMGGQPVVVQGRMVAVGSDAPVMLSRRERDLLLVLAQRPGAVLSKRDLLGRVWGGREGDAHAVEVAVGRLRQRLGPSGAAVETVFRRGYRLSAE